MIFENTVITNDQIFNYGYMIIMSIIIFIIGEIILFKVFSDIKLSFFNFMIVNIFNIMFSVLFSFMLVLFILNSLEELIYGLFGGIIIMIIFILLYKYYEVKNGK